MNRKKGFQYKNWSHNFGGLNVHCEENLFTNRFFCKITVITCEKSPIILSNKWIERLFKSCSSLSILCAQFYAANWTQIFISFGFYWKLLSIYTKSDFDLQSPQSMWSFLESSCHRFTCKLVSFSMLASKYHIDKQCCEIDRKSLKRKIDTWVTLTSVAWVSLYIT